MIPVPAEAGKNTKSAAGGNAARMGVVTMTIKLEQVLKAIEMADDAYTYFYDTQTGETVFLSDAIITGERDEALEELIDNSPEGRFLRFPQRMIFTGTALWRTLYTRCLPGQPVRSLSAQSVAEARSGGSRTGFVIIVWNSSGMPIKIRHTGILPYAGARMRESNIRRWNHPLFHNA